MRSPLGAALVASAAAISKLEERTRLAKSADADADTLRLLRKVRGDLVATAVRRGDGEALATVDPSELAAYVAPRDLPPGLAHETAGQVTAAHLIAAARRGER